MSEHLPQDPVCLDLYGPHDPRFRSCAGCNAYRRVREDERERLGDPFARAGYNTGRRNGYAAALRDAVEAVKALGNEPQPAHDGSPKTWSQGFSNARTQAVAAIEALGGER